MWARLPRGGICTNRLRVGAEFIKPMLMIPFIVQNLNAIGQTEGAINPSVISTRLAGLQAIADRNFKTRYPIGWVAGFGRLCPYSPTLTGSVGESRKRPLPKPLPTSYSPSPSRRGRIRNFFYCRRGFPAPPSVQRHLFLIPPSPTRGGPGRGGKGFGGLGLPIANRILKGVGFYRLSPFRIQVQLSRIDLLVAPWLPPSLSTRGSFLHFPPPQPRPLGPTQSLPLALYFPKNTPRKPRPAGSRRSELRFKRAIFAHFPCIKLRSAVPEPATKQTQNYAFFSFLKEKLRRIINFFEHQKNCSFSLKAPIRLPPEAASKQGFHAMSGVKSHEARFS